jgi:hypothetical protein
VSLLNTNWRMALHCLMSESTSCYYLYCKTWT